MLFLLISAAISDSGRPPTAPAVDDALILRISDGDKDALAELYNQTSTAVYGFALSILGNASLAEDVMQEVYLRIYNAAASYKPMKKPMAWILTITRNESLQKMRDDRSSRQVPLEQAWDLAEKRNHYRTTEDRMVLTAAMETLTEEERQIVVLYSVSGLKHREIAKLLQLPLSTVLSKYRRTIAKIKKQIEEGDAQ